MLQANSLAPAGGLRLIRRTGWLVALGYLLYFFLLHSHALWQSPTLVQDRWKKIFYPLVGLFPQWFVRPYRGSDVGYIPVVMFVVLLAFLFLVYGRLLKGVFAPGAILAKDARPAFRAIFGVTLVVLAILLIVPGVLSTDLFSYIWYGRIFVDFHANPFLHVPADYKFSDSTNWLQWVYWKETPSVYGPVWVAMAGAIEWISQRLDGDIVNAVLGNKLLADLSHLANIVLVWKIAGIVIPKFWSKPRVLPQGVAEADWATGAQVGVTLLYAWNPLVLIEFGANGHNDILMVTAVLAAVWLHLTGRWQLAVTALALATLVKLIAIIFLPGYLWLLFWQAAPGAFRNGLGRRISLVAGSCALVATIMVISYLPFWAGPATLKPLLTGPPLELYVNSIGDLLRWKLPQLVSGIAGNLGLQPDDFWTVTAIGDRIDHFIRTGMTLIVAAVALVMTWRARTFPTMVIAWGWVLFAYLTVGAVWFWPWYVVWLLPLAALVGPGRLLKGTLILSGTSMLLYATFWISSHTIAELETWKSVIIEVPPLAYVLGSLWLARRRGRASVPAPSGRTRELPEAVRVPVAPVAVPQLARRLTAADYEAHPYGGSPAESFLSSDQMDC